MENIINDNSINTYKENTKKKPTIQDTTINTEFEKCFTNKLFENNKKSDSDILKKMKDYTSIQQINLDQKEDIHFLKKLINKIIYLKKEDIKDCLELITNTSIKSKQCDNSVLPIIIQKGGFILSLIGNNNINLNNLTKEDIQHITLLLSELDEKRLLKALKKIIYISKVYEMNTCGDMTRQTEFYETLYENLYKPNNNKTDTNNHTNNHTNNYMSDLFTNVTSIIDVNNRERFIQIMVMLLVFAFVFSIVMNPIIQLLTGKST